jgi:cell division septation protein DedD
LSETLQTIGQSSGPERRVHSRERVLFSSLQLADRNGGIVLNICEHGLAMRVVNGLADDQFTELRFQVCQSTDWVETRGRIAWVDDPRTTVGVEFVDLPLEGRSVLEKWIASIRDLDRNAHEADPATESGATQPAVALQAPAETPSPEVEREEALVEQRQEARAPQAVQNSPGLAANAIPSSHRTVADSGAERFNTDPSQSSPSVAASLGVLEASPDELSFRTERRRRQPSDRKWTVLIVGLAIVVLVLEGLYGLAQYRRSQDSVVEENRNAVAAARPQTDAKKLTPSPGTSPQSSAGFVVQVGAMAQRDDAVALADSLQRKGFPSFVFKRDSSRLYEVLIGPYATAEAAGNIGKALENQGTSTFVRSWPLE